MIYGNGLLGRKMTCMISLKGGKGFQSIVLNILENMALIQISSKDISCIFAVLSNSVQPCGL